MGNDPLSDEEVTALRALLEAERRMAWLRSNMRVWAMYLSGGVLTGFALWKALTEYVQIKIGVR